MTSALMPPDMEATPYTLVAADVGARPQNTYRRIKLAAISFAAVAAIAFLIPRPHVEWAIPRLPFRQRAFIIPRPHVDWEIPRLPFRQRYIEMQDEPPPLKMLLIMDWHADPFYNRSLGPLCKCNNATGRATSACVLQKEASRYGQIGCDAPPALNAASLEAAAAALPQPDLVLVLGDLVMHKAPSKKLTMQIFDEMSAAIAKTFLNKPKACTVPLGNADVFPDYYVNNSDTQYYEAQAKVAMEHCGIDAVTAKRFSRYGYYNLTMVKHRLLVLVINTNIYSPENCPDGVYGDGLYGDEESGFTHNVCGKDPLGQFEWLEQQLSTAESLGYRVHIHGHIPPVVDSYERIDMWAKAYTPMFWNLVERHADVLSGLFFGHFHSAEVRATRRMNAKSTPALQILSSVSPSYKSYPVFYTATYSPRTYLIETFMQHSLNLETVGEGEDAEFVASPRAVPTTGLTNADYLKWAELWRTPAGDASFTAFFDQFKAGYHGDQRNDCTQVSDRFDECATCTGGCRAAFTCLMSHGTSTSEYQACVTEYVWHPFHG